MLDHYTERGESRWDVRDEIGHINGREVDDVEAGWNVRGAEEFGLGGGERVGGGNDEEADVEVVVGDEVFCEFEEWDYVAHCWDWEESYVGFCGLAQLHGGFI